MAPTWPGLVILLQLFIVPVKLCEIPHGNTRLIQSLNLKLLRATLDTSNIANPSVYVGLRLSEAHHLQTEVNYLQKLKVSMQTLASSANKEEPSTGILALHLLALKASCENMDTPESKKLITNLKLQLHEEKRELVMKQRLKSNYYQYSLGILALCVNKKKVDKHIINKLLDAEEHNKFDHGESISIDTEAMAGLAFLCLKRSDEYPTDLTRHLGKAIESVKQKILDEKSTDGFYGNIYSTPLAVQFLSAMGTKDTQACSKTIDSLLEAIKQGKFVNPMMMSQLMPVLHHKSYLDVEKVDCTSKTDNPLLNPSSVLPAISTGEDLLKVQLVVEATPGQAITHDIYVPSRSSLLDILQKAKNQNPNFKFETKDSLYGPYLSSVNGVAASLGERTYWQLLKHPNISLVEGIADYRPEDGERIILRLSKW